MLVVGNAGSAPDQVGVANEVDRIGCRNMETAKVAELEAALQNACHTFKSLKYIYYLFSPRAWHGNPVAKREISPSQDAAVSQFR